MFNPIPNKAMLDFPMNHLSFGSIPSFKLGKPFWTINNDIEPLYPTWIDYLQIMEHF